MNTTPYENLVAKVRSLSPLFTHFHLSPCTNCGTPSFQQPCPFCGHYPMGGNNGLSQLSANERLANAAEFVKRVARHGNIVCWYIASFRNTVAYKGINSEPPTPGFKEKIEALYEQAVKLENLPTAAEVWFWCARGEDDRMRFVLQNGKGRYLNGLGKSSANIEKAYTFYSRESAEHEACVYKMTRDDVRVVMIPGKC